VDHHGQAEGAGHFLRAPKHLVIVGPGHIPRQPRLDTDNEVAVLGDGVVRRTDVGALEVHRVAFGQDAGASDVDQHAALLRRRSRDANRLADAIGPLRSRIDPPSYTVLQHEAGSLGGARGMCVGCVARDCGFNRDDAPSRDGHVADRIEPDRGVDDAPALDDQVVFCCKRSRNACEHRRACSDGC